jgi:hypothetical protein
MDDHSAPSKSSAELQELLGLADEELLEILGSTPVDLITGQEDEREDLRVLVSLTRDAADPAVLRRWVRASGPHGRPLDLLLRGDFTAYEAAVITLGERGFVVTATPGRGASRPARRP